MFVARWVGMVLEIVSVVMAEVEAEAGIEVEVEVALRFAEEAALELEVASLLDDSCLLRCGSFQT